MPDDRESMRFDTTAPTTATLGVDLALERLLVVYAPDPRDVGVSRVLGARPLEIGRAPGAEGALVLYDGEASRVHAVVERRDGAPWLVDRSSRNGTFVAGARVESAALAPGDVIRIGGHVLLFQRISARALSRAPAARSASLLGASFALADLLEHIAAAARLRVPVLIRGETGTGKELVARELHRASGRAGALVPVNCAALPEPLAEAELFGHARGAFTGAQERSSGLFGAADGGTLFLDEIGDMPLTLQAKLLRALESGEIRAVGEVRARAVEVGVIAATHVDLEEAVERGRFRGDLLARLSGAVIAVPPLRARREDVLPILAAKLAPGRSPAELVGPDAAEALVAHDWPFNVRELVQLAGRLSATSGRVELRDLPEPLRARVAARHLGVERPSEPSVPALTARPASGPTREELQEAAAHFRGNVSRIAAFFGKERRQIYRWAERLEVDLGAHRDD